MHIKQNVAHKERVYVDYDEFLSNTLLNRVLKAACRKLLRMARRSSIQRGLKEAILLFADVPDVVVRRNDLSNYKLSRNSERFADVFTFAKIVLFDGSPTPTSGATESFSMLVPMDKLFEEFIGQVIRRHAVELGFERSNVKLQGKGNQKHLLRKSGASARYYKLKPDVLICGDEQPYTRVLDTKWKRLDTKSNQRPVESDMYQLYAYANRYEAPLSVLLYPQMPGLESVDYELENDELGRRVRVAFVDMGRDLRKGRAELVQELAMVLQ